MQLWQWYLGKIPFKQIQTGEFWNERGVFMAKKSDSLGGRANEISPKQGPGTAALNIAMVVYPIVIGLGPHLHASGLSSCLTPG